MPRPALAALALLTVVLVAGCSGDGDDKPAPTAESSATLSAADRLVQTGLQQLDAGDDVKARATFENVLELDPDNVYAHYNLGLLAQEAGKQDVAIERYDAALATDPAFAPALYNKGIVLETTDLDASVELYRRAVAADPEMAAAHMRLGFALLHLGETEEAEEHLATGVELDPSMADVEAPSYD
ncbi:tetratricopeptide repeat protein [Nocardioides sp. LHD-245]|uniref:tetratricopeptide repeat protein n=1 Tax=Nocardioides sp. LHD-245 TaxID=3051387 RepID=UPI0027E17768|nr:tetratricopeptide repeat protein [Nocardioides sp. LHD-245]